MESLKSEPDDLTIADTVNTPQIQETKKKRKRSKPKSERIVKQVPYNPVPEFMPRETINDQSIPKPRSELFKKKDEIVERVKSYSREAGFSIRLAQVDNNPYRFQILCSKSAQSIKGANPESDQEVSISEPVCPFNIQIQKVEEHWRVTYIN